MLALSLVVFLPLGVIRPATAPMTHGPTPCPTMAPPTLADYRDEKAAKLSALVESNYGEPALRRRLVAQYRNIPAYGHVAEFYALSADYLDEKEAQTTRPRTLVSSLPCDIYQGATVAQAKQAARAVPAIAQSVARQVNRDMPPTGSGLAAAEKATHDHGPRCRLLAEWAHALLVYATVHRDKTTADTREMAVRLLIALAEDNISPEGYEGPASVYFFLAEYFSSYDPVSAYTAALIAKDRLDAGSATGSEDSESFKRRLDELISKLAKLAAVQRAGKH